MRVCVVVGVSIVMVCGFAGLADARAPQPAGGSRHAAVLAQADVRHPSDDVRERMRLKIGITHEQEAEFEALHEQVEKQRQAIGRQMRQMYERLMRLYDSYDFDRKEVDRVRNEIMRLHRRRSDVYAENEVKIRKILTREQFNRLRALMKQQWENRRRSMDRFPGGPGGHPGHDRPGGRPPAGA